MKEMHQSIRFCLPFNILAITVVVKHYRRCVILKQIVLVKLFTVENCDAETWQWQAQNTHYLSIYANLNLAQNSCSQGCNLRISNVYLSIY